MKTALILVLFDLMLNWTNIQIGCLGLPLPERNEDVAKQQSRLTRSFHALHSHLCPEGSSTESCFYSQLSMFMRMQDSLMDPVALRNIGKRSSLHNKLNHLDPLTTEHHNNFNALGFKSKSNNEVQRDLQFSFAQKRENFVNMLNELKAIFNGKETSLEEHVLKNFKTPYVYFVPTDFDNVKLDTQRESVFNTPEESLQSLDSVMPQLSDEENKKLLSSYLGNDQRNTKREIQNSQMNRKTPSGLSLRKRQIICPPGVPRLNCYDNALDFYMRLLKTVKYH